ncbi:LysR family transcriptional regulator [Bradyrhizobium macuxiense]|uniref:LysR family transcriptional regulator n=1 Tax=Bradyrhizobium macuxiense TaxID=1755647 RepID=A0A560KWX0_9BRAD|nr:LysR family transcriptional regulator [Bradyrhizobium macuxiense]TWB87733.1 LysR family transcriptional regulator [Bradyrhizobium macuxiense]
MMDALTLDQIRTFLAVVDAGSFSAAARRQNRATSAITYAIDKMEEQLGVQLFNRTGYRPRLTEEGQALLPRTRRVVDEIDGLRIAARGIASGLEPEVSIAIDTMFPMSLLSAPLREFQARFPGVQLRIIVETLGSSARLVAEGHCAIGLVTEFAASGLDLASLPFLEIALVLVVSPDHPLAKIADNIDIEILKQYVQLVLADRSRVTGSRDYGVYTGQTCRLSDLGAKHEMLRAGLGFGTLPVHLARDDLLAGRLVPLRLTTNLSGPARFPIVLARRNDYPLGPAGQWLVGRLSSNDFTSESLKQRLIQLPDGVRNKNSKRNRKRKAVRRTSGRKSSH